MIKRKHKAAAFWLLVLCLAILIMRRQMTYWELQDKQSQHQPQQHHAETHDHHLELQKLANDHLFGQEPQPGEAAGVADAQLVKFINKGDDEEAQQMIEMARARNENEFEKLRQMQAEIERKEALEKDPLFGMQLDGRSDFYGDPDVRMPAAYQVSTYRTARRLVYCKLALTGSTSFRSLLEHQLAPAVHFTYTNQDDLIPRNFRLKNQTEEKIILKQLLKPAEPAVITLPVQHIDYNRHEDVTKAANSSVPVFIGIVREPTRRLASIYYENYYRLPRRAHAKPPPSFDKCLLDKEPACMSIIEDMSQMAFFCGLQPICRKPNRKALEEAIRNVEKFYAVVGVTSEMSKLTTVLEWLMPQFFKGARPLMDTVPFLNARRYLTPSHATHAILRELLPYEFEFYGYVRRRFDAMLEVVEQKKTAGIIP